MLSTAVSLASDFSSGALTFQQSGGLLFGAKTAFSAGSTILTDGTNSTTPNPLVLRLTNTNGLGDISTANVGAGGMLAESSVASIGSAPEP